MLHYFTWHQLIDHARMMTDHHSHSSQWWTASMLNSKGLSTLRPIVQLLNTLWESLGAPRLTFAGVQSQRPDIDDGFACSPQPRTWRFVTWEHCENTELLQRLGHLGDARKWPGHMVKLSDIWKLTAQPDHISPWCCWMCARIDSNRSFLSAPCNTNGYKWHRMAHWHTRLSTNGRSSPWDLQLQSPSAFHPSDLDCKGRAVECAGLSTTSDPTHFQSIS